MKSGVQSSAVTESMGPRSVQWDLSSMEIDELLTENTIWFVAKVSVRRLDISLES